jgi:predicted nucleic acid-binding protein
VDATPNEVATRLRVFCSGPDHHFWGDSVSLLDDRLFQTRMIVGPRKITDAYLLGLAVHYRGKLATFDRSIPLKAVPGATSQHLDLIG